LKDLKEQELLTFKP